MESAATAAPMARPRFVMRDIIALRCVNCFRCCAYPTVVPGRGVLHRSHLVLGLGAIARTVCFGSPRLVVPARPTSHGASDAATALDGGACDHGRAPGGQVSTNACDVGSCRGCVNRDRFAATTRTLANSPPFRRRLLYARLGCDLGTTSRRRNRSAATLPRSTRATPRRSAKLVQAEPLAYGDQVHGQA